MFESSIPSDFPALSRESEPFKDRSTGPSGVVVQKFWSSGRFL